MVTTTINIDGIVEFKGRRIDPVKPVRAYLNLNKTGSEGKPWYSIMQGGRVVAHADRLVLENVSFHVNEAGRQRVIAQQRKNVHAIVEGYVSAEQTQTLDEGDAHECVRYNPYFTATFMANDKPIHEAEIVIFDGPQLWARR